MRPPTPMTSRVVPVSALILTLTSCGQELTESAFQEPPTAVSGREQRIPSDRVSAPMAPELAALAEHRGAGMVPVTGAWSGELEEGTHRDVQVVLEPGRCYRILGVGGPGVEDLDLILFDSNGLLKLQDTAQDPRPVVGLVPPLCPESAGVYRLRVRSHRGAGSYVAQLFGTD